jgi:hypothetical protein
MKAFAVIFFLCFGTSGVLTGQTIVGTSSENKKAILEEYGGIYCVYCPEGNQIAESILADHPGEVFRINIEEGLYANPEDGDPDFRSDYGEAFLNQTGLIGFPAGTINRMVFPGIEQGNPGSTALGRGHWAEAVEQILDQQSIVNVAATATVDYETNQLDIFVEFFYTGTSDVNTNYLNIALLQNKVYGPQLGGNEGQNYEHNHLLRDMITGQWGDPIFNTVYGHFESRTYSYQLPSEYREVPFDSPNMELAVFISEYHQNILNGISIKPDFIIPNANDANALLLPSPEIICGNEIAPVFTIRNEGNQPLTSLDIEYRINAEDSHVYEWTGNLNTFETEEIILPTVYFIGLLQEENFIHVSVDTPNEVVDENSENNEISTPFILAPPSATSTVTLELKTDGFGFDIYWEITNEDNTVIAHGGNEDVGENGGGNQVGSPSDPGAYGDNQTITEQIELPSEGCYNFRILDDYGDGICCQYGYGFFYLHDEEGNIIFTGGEFGIEKNEPFAFGGISTVVEEENIYEDIIVYPNPVTEGKLTFEINLKTTETLNVELFDMNSRITYSTTEEMLPAGLFTKSIDTRHLPSGIYFLKLTNQTGSVSRKVVLLR